MRKRKREKRSHRDWTYQRLVELVVIPFLVSLFSQWLATYISHWIH
jgi:hypothetical protein